MKRNEDKGSNIAITILLIIFIALVALLILVVTGKINFRDITGNHKIYTVDEYITLEDVKFNSKVSTKKVKFNHLDESVTGEFYDDQERVIDSIHVSDDEVFNAEYKLKYALNGDILSVLYMIEETNQMGTCATMAAVTNIDLKKNEVIDEEELLKKAGTSYRHLVSELYDEELKRWNELNKEAEKDIDYYEVTYKEFSSNKDKYVNIGVEKIPSVIYTYVENGEIKYDYYTIKLDTLFHQVGKGGCFNWNTIKLGNYK